MSYGDVRDVAVVDDVDWENGPGAQRVNHDCNKQKAGMPVQPAPERSEPSAAAVLGVKRAHDSWWHCLHFWVDASLNVTLTYGRPPLSAQDLPERAVVDKALRAWWNVSTWAKAARPRH
ncbi:hypothetical protein GCM10009868_15660 [Terrabacter aerolatus]|uniref:Uncharacterized protein n=1 Tax=Terrabacter aerolatus TaxID=422442 RepID=A0A512D3V1_9MICO|nr:hypothetical protein TAE01_29420 [Terrabacter aerolatus]